jgi:hypothetical protein
MTQGIPLGESEGARLEFKGKMVLEEPDRIVREIVGMLNAGGGEVWVGLGERDGRAVDLESIPNAEQEVARLRNVCLDTIEPAPRDNEVELDVVSSSKGERVIRITVTTDPARGPYAQLRRGGGRYFGVRFGERNHNMDRDELARRFRDGVTTAGAREQAFRQLTDLRRKLQSENAKCLWLALRPTPAVSVSRHDELKELFRNAEPTNNRPNGWNFISAYKAAEVKADRVVLRIEREGVREVSVHDDGMITLRLDLVDLHWKGASDELWPLMLIEYPTSVVRLAGVVYGQFLSKKPRRPTLVLGDVALLGAQGWKLRPYSPLSPDYAFDDAEPGTATEDVEWSDPIELDMAKISAQPDACAYQIVRRIYRGFGFTEDEIPREFRDGRLTIA